LTKIEDKIDEVSKGVIRKVFPLKMTLSQIISKKIDLDILDHPTSSKHPMANQESNERFTWVLRCSGRVIGSKSSEGADNLLRLHKKKCEMCYNTDYLCVDETDTKTKWVKGANQWKANEKRYKDATKKLTDLVNLK
jgi:hypothetical protein